MDGVEVLQDLFGRIGPAVHSAVEGADDAALVARIGPEANTLAWLAWHIARCEDAQVADAVGVEEVWTSQGWARRFDLPFDDAAIGYGQTPAEVGQVRVGTELLLGYLDAVRQASTALFAGLGDSDLDGVVDRRWDPPVTLGVRLVSVAGDCFEHAGQAAYLRGILDRSR